MRRAVVVLSVVFAVLAAIRLFVGSLLWTGDEPPYTYEALGIYTNHALYPTEQEWERFVSSMHYASAHYPYRGRITKPPNTFAPTIIYGPLLVWFGLDAARWLSYILGCIGIAAIYFLLRTAFQNRDNAIWPIVVPLFIVSLTLPLLPYLQLVYPEALLFAVGSLALYCLVARHVAGTLAFTTILLFLHIRALPLACAFFVLLLVDVKGRISTKYVCWMLAAMAAGLTVRLLLQLFSLSGDAFSPNPVSLAIVPERVGMQLWDSRHGLLAYSPIFLASFAGLISGTFRRDRLCTYCSVLFFIYVASFIWSSASESWTARFWVAALPFLAVGLSYWLGSVPSPRWSVALLPLVLVTAVNAALFVAHPVWFLDNRRTSVTYAELYDVSNLHLGLFLPADSDPGGLPPYTKPIPMLLAYTAVAVALLAACVLAGQRSRKACALLAVAVLLVPFVVCAGSSLSASSYRERTNPATGVASIHLFDSRTKIRAVQFDGMLFRYWTRQNVPDYFHVTCKDAGRIIAQVAEPSRPLVTLPKCSGATDVEISGKASNGQAPLYANPGHISLIAPTF